MNMNIVDEQKTAARKIINEDNTPTLSPQSRHTAWTHQISDDEDGTGTIEYPATPAIIVRDRKRLPGDHLYPLPLNLPSTTRAPWWMITMGPAPRHGSAGEAVSPSNLVGRPPFFLGWGTSPGPTMSLQTRLHPRLGPGGTRAGANSGKRRPTGCVALLPAERIFAGCRL